ALRTQQILAFESGIAGTVDPLAGSYFVESLTTELEKRATDLLARVEERGGAVRAVEQGFFQEEIARSAYEQQMRVESGATVVVGVNRFADEKDPPVIHLPDYKSLEEGQVGRLRKVRAARDAESAKRALASLLSLAQKGANGL